MFAAVCFGGSRELPSCFGAFVGGVVGRVLAAAPRASFSVGCAVWRGCAGVAVAGGAWRCCSCLGLLRWGCVWRGLLALLGLLGGPVRGCGWRVPGLARGRSALGPAGGAAGGAFACGARPWRRPGVGRVLVSVLARLAWLARCGPGGGARGHPGRRLLLRVGVFSARSAVRRWCVGAGARWPVRRRLRLAAGGRCACPRGPRSAVRRVAGCRGVPSLRRSVRPARVRRCSRAVRLARSASAGELRCGLCRRSPHWGRCGFRRAAPFFAVSVSAALTATSASVRPSIASHDDIVTQCRVNRINWPRGQITVKKSNKERHQ